MSDAEIQHMKRVFIVGGVIGAPIIGIAALVVTLLGVTWAFPVVITMVVLEVGFVIAFAMERKKRRNRTGR